MKKALITLLLFNLSLLAQGVENAGLSFLKLGLNARQVALGSSGAADAVGADAIFYNPALLVGANGRYLSFSHHQIMRDATSETAGALFNLFGLPVGLAINTTSVADIEIRTKAGKPQGYFNAHYFLASFSTGIKISKYLNAGASLKYLYEGLFVDESHGYAVDIGFSSTGILKKLKLGLDLKNLGSMNNLRSKPTKLPSSLILGGAYLFDFPWTKVQAKAIVGGEKFFGETGLHLNAGAEIIYQRKLFLRAGYLTGYEAKSFSFGIGFKISVFQLDYAFAPNKYNLGDAHFLTLSVNVTNIFN